MKSAPVLGLAILAAAFSLNAPAQSFVSGKAERTGTWEAYGGQRG